MNVDGPPPETCEEIEERIKIAPTPTFYENGLTYPDPGWEEGKNYWTFPVYAAVGQDWVDAPPLVEHYNPAKSRARKAKPESWTMPTWDDGTPRGNYTPTDQPLGGHLQVIVDTSTKVTFHYCQAGHIHVYNNGELLTGTLDEGTAKAWGYLWSKHFPARKYPKHTGATPSGEKKFSLRDKTVVRTPFCGD